MGHAAKVKPLEENDSGAAVAGREGDVARRALEEDVLAQFAQLAVDVQGALAVLDDNGVDAVVVAQVSLGAGARHGNGLRCRRLPVVVEVAARVEQAQRVADGARVLVMLVARTRVLAVVEPERTEVVLAEEQGVQRVRAGEVDVEVAEEAADGRVRLGLAGGVGARDAGVVGQDLAHAHARRVADDEVGDGVAEARGADHVAQDPGVNQRQPVVLLLPAERERAAVDVVEEEVEAAWSHRRDAPSLDVRVGLQHAREVDHVFSHEGGVDGEGLLVALQANLDVDDALKLLRHGVVFADACGA